MQVREIMTANPAVATSDTSLRQIAQMMVEHDCGCVPIVQDMTDKKPIGTITDRDITIRAFATGQNPAELKASDAMTMGVATITPDASIEKCADVMEDKKIRRVVVVNDDGKVVGMVAQADIAEYGPNTSLIGNVVNEISDAPASPNRGVYNRMRGNQSYSSNRMPQPSPNRSHRFSGGDYESHTYRSNRSTRKEKSSFGISSLLPLLAGVGISFAAKYYLGSNEKPHRRRIAPRPTNDVSTGLPHSTDTSVSVETTGSTGTIGSIDMSRSASASGSTGASSSTGTSSSFGSSSSTGGSGRSDFGNQTSGGSADLDTFGSGDFKSAGGDDLKPILEVGRNPGNV
jgi:CBS domain-containing protein